MFAAYMNDNECLYGHMLLVLWVISSTSPKRTQAPCIREQFIV